VTTVGPTLRIKGELAGDEDVTVEGRVDGIVNLTKLLTVSKTGVVEADTRAQTVIIHGRVLGNVIAEQRVEILQSGRLEGNIKSPKISIHEGAHFKGNVDMSGSAPSAGGAEEGSAPPLKKQAFDKKR
jgi:cytoskeletal protein CcmA (bactofilin family)